MKPLHLCCAIVILILACAACLARDYYISAQGNDANPGTSSEPWRTIEKVNGTEFRPGDRLLFEGARTFAGTLHLDSGDSGAPGNKVTVGSYGSGRATINGGTGRAIWIDGCNQLVVRGLRLAGAGRKTGNTASGLVLESANDVEVDDIEVLGFRSSGVEFKAMENARITRGYAHQNGLAGISSYVRGQRRSRNVYIGYCLTENNPGDPSLTEDQSGSGIILGYTDEAIIERCEARYNGWDMRWTGGNGPVGIWTLFSDRVTIQFCVSHHNRSTTGDGGGFDFDSGVTNSILQYNYSHDNFGAGYLICQFRGETEPFVNNVVRYNISQDDGLKGHNAGIYVSVGGTNMKNALVYNNTVFNTKGSAVKFGVDKEFVGQLPTITFYNNILVSNEPQIQGVYKIGRFIGNLYWGLGERGFGVTKDYTDFSVWVAATGQEKIGDRIVGRFADPLLRKDGIGQVMDPEKLITLVEYEVLPGSPAIDNGLDLKSLFGIDSGNRDFYGTRLPSNGKFDVGAHEFEPKRIGESKLGN